MKNYSTIFLTVFFLLNVLTFTINGQPVFSKKINTLLYENNPCHVLTADQDAIVYAASTVSIVSPNTQKGMVIAKVDIAGNLLWRKSYDPGMPKWSMNPATIMEQSYGYLVAGNLTHAKGDVTLMKIDTDGNLLAFNRLHPNANHHPVMFPSDMVVRPDGAFVLTGIVGYGHQHSDVLWIKTNDDFSSYSVKSIQSVKDIEGIRIFAEPNNKTIIALNNGNLLGDNTAFPSLMKLDTEGNVLNTVNYKLPFAAILNDCIRLTDGSFVMVGTGKTQSYILKVNSSFDLVWYHSYPIANNGINLTGVFGNVINTADGGFLVSGSQDISGSITPSHQFLMKTDDLGIATSYLLGQGTDDQGITGILPFSDGTYIASGLAKSAFNVFTIGADLTTSCPYSIHSIVASDGIVVTDKNNLAQSGKFVNAYYLESADLTVLNEGTLVDYCSPLRESSDLLFTNESLQLFPNPASNQLNIALPSSFLAGNTIIEIINLLGQHVAQYSITNEISVSLNIDQLPAGNYLVKALSEAGIIATAKLHVQ